jgi:hypothetical protein
MERRRPLHSAIPQSSHRFSSIPASSKRRFMELRLRDSAKIFAIGHRRARALRAPRRTAFVHDIVANRNRAWHSRYVAGVVKRLYGGPIDGLSLKPCPHRLAPDRFVPGSRAEAEPADAGVAVVALVVVGLDGGPVDEGASHPLSILEQAFAVVTGRCPK